MKNSISLMLMLAGLMGINKTASAQKIDEKDLKLNVANVVEANKLLAALNPVTFDFNTDQFKNLDLPAGKQFGFTVSETKSNLPGIVREDAKIVSVGKNSTKTVRYDDVDYKSIITLLVSAVQEQQKEIENLKHQIEQLKK